MSDKTYLPEGQTPPPSQIGASLESLAATIAARRGAGQESYTFRLLAGELDQVLKKVMEESGEVALAAKDAESALRAYAAHKSARGIPEPMREARAQSYDAAVDHLRYEAADVVYHLLVVLERFGIGIDEFAAELNNRMRSDERPQGAIRLLDDHVRRGKE